MQAMWIKSSFFICACLLSIACGSRDGVGAQKHRSIESFTLQSETFANTRNIQVSLPVNYQADQRYGVFYFTDGGAAFDEPGWNVPGVVAQLEKEGAIKEFIFVAIDNGGATVEAQNPSVDRASEYIPYEDPSWTEEPIPTPRGDQFPDFLVNEVMQEVAARYSVDNAASKTGLAGTSFGGLITLYTLVNHPEKFGYALIESPSLHVGEGILIDQTTKLKDWRGRIHIGVGTEEGDTHAIKRQMLDNAKALAVAIENNAPGAVVRLDVTEGGTHWYDAWRERLPAALEFLLTSEG